MKNELLDANRFEKNISDFCDLCKRKPLVAIYYIIIRLLAFIVFPYTFYQNANLKDQLSNMKSEKETLEIQLVPFRTIALERFTGTETEVLNKLALQIRNIEQELDKAKAMAEPSKLIFNSNKIKKTDKGFLTTIRFKPTKNQSLGQIIFFAKLPDKSKAKILNFWPSIENSPAFQFGKQSKQIDGDGQNARLIYSLISFGYPSIDLEVSEATEVRIEGNYLIEPLDLKIE